MEEIHQDCLYFRSSIPCSFHKKDGSHCKGCKHYSPISFKILIIKLEAAGDVLRTTSILPPLKEKYPSSHITWIAKGESHELFKNNPYIDCLLDVGFSSYLKLTLERYDLVLSLDVSFLGSQIATLVNAKEKLGFGYSSSGFIYPFNKEAEKWYKMGLFDDIKRKNTRTYQEIILDVCRLKPKNQKIIFVLDNEEKAKALSFSKKHNLSALTIGLNTGGGSRWKNKRWTIEGFVSLVSIIKKNIKNASILLLGGKKEKEINRLILEKCKEDIIDTGCDNTLREFGGFISLCDIVVTGDTLGLHIACALEKKVVALFGPTSYNEIDLYGRGKKLYANIDCLGCYRNDCDVSLNCMELIKPEDVFLAIKELL